MHDRKQFRQEVRRVLRTVEPGHHAIFTLPENVCLCRIAYQDAQAVAWSLWGSGVYQMEKLQPTATTSPRVLIGRFPVGQFPKTRAPHSRARDNGEEQRANVKWQLFEERYRNFIGETTDPSTIKP